MWVQPLGFGIVSVNQPHLALAASHQAVDDMGNDPSVADRARAWMDEKLRHNDQEDDAWELS